MKTIDVGDSKYLEAIDLKSQSIIWVCATELFFHIINLIFNRDTNNCMHNEQYIKQNEINPYPTAFPYENGMVLHFYQQQESSTTKTVHKVINKGLKAYV